jgi:type III secretion system YscQ/HrcQ family protein
VGLRAYPWRSLERVRRDDARAGSVVRSALRAWGERSRLEGATTSLLGAEVSVRERAAGAGAVPLPPDAVGVVLARGERRVALEVEAPLAAAISARALRRAPPRIPGPGPGPSPALAGALAAVLCAVARRCGDEPVRIVACGAADATLRELPERASLAFTVTVEHDAFVARVSVPREELHASAPPSLGSALPLEVPLVAATALLGLRELASLRVGDALVPGTLSVRRAGGAWAGSAVLCAGPRELGVRARLGEDGALVLVDEAVALPWAPAEESMEAREALLESVGDAPVVVRVEVGSARMTAREWSALGPGDVVALGRRIAEPVVLRAGGVEIASGELVDLDGELAVRILARNGEAAG